MSPSQMQTIIICFLFGLLGTALFYQRYSLSHNRGRYSPARKILTSLAGGMFFLAGWFALCTLAKALPQPWSNKWVPFAGIALLSLLSPSTAPAAYASQEDLESMRRIKRGLMVGIGGLVAICLLTVWRN